MEMMIQVTLLCVVGAVLSLVLKKVTPEMALVLTLLTVVFIFLFLSDSVRDIFRVLRELGEASGISDVLVVPLYKTVGIALVVKVGESLCEDAGANALGAAVETAGTVCAFLVALPIVQAVLDMLMELIQ